MDVAGGCLEVVEVATDDGGFERGVITASRLYANFDFECVGREVTLMRLWPRGPCILVRFRSMTHLLDVFPVLTISELRTVAALHALTFSRTAVKSAIMQSLRVHQCDARCSDCLTFVFRTNRNPRRIRGNRSAVPSSSAFSPSFVTSRDVANASSSSSAVGRESDFMGDFPFFFTRDFRNEMIRAWQERMHPSSQARLPCAVCGQCFKEDHLCVLPASRVDLPRLRNEFLPAEVAPTTYDFRLYEQAILCPAGLENPWALSDVRMCVSCRRALMDEHTMPLDALANFQYYAYSELSTEVVQAFKQASIFDLMLVG